MASPVILDARVVTGSGGGPDKTLLNSPRFLDPLGYRMLCVYLHPPNDPCFEAIRTNAEAGALLLADVPEQSEVRAILNDIVDDDARASEIIDNIRMLLRKEEPATRAVDLNEICSHAAQLLRGDAMLRGARLELTLEPQLPQVAGDPVQLQQVVLNLALNALDAAAGSDGEHEVTVGTAARGNEAELFVRDTGPGLTPELQEHLFESFYTTKAH